MNKVDTFHCTQPCSNCPYRTDAPLKHWHIEEYKKLLETENDFLGSVYNCHKNNGSICVGWLMKQDENRFPSIALRLALSRNNITRKYLDTLNSPAPLYKDVKKMIRANYPKLLKTIIIFLLFPLLSIGQRIEIPKFKSYVPSGVFVFLAGATDGLRDASMYRMDGANNWWNGKQSWLNKYKNRDINQGEAYFGSTSVFIAPTDCPHAANWATHELTGWSMVMLPYDSNKKFFHVFLKVAAYNAIRQLGHSLLYDVIFHP